MTRSKLSTKAVLLAGAIGLSTADYAGLQPAAAQSYSDEYTCPARYGYDPTYGCTLSGDAYEPYDYGGDYGYLPYGAYGLHHGWHRGFGHAFAHGMGVEGTIVHHGMGFHHSIGVAHFGSSGFGHGIGGFGHSMGGLDHDIGRGVGAAHFAGGGFAHGIGGGFHGGGGFGGGGHR